MTAGRVTYDQSVRPIAVRVGGVLVGHIHQSPSGYHYRPGGLKRHRTPDFPTLAACKASLEGNDSNGH